MKGLVPYFSFCSTQRACMHAWTSFAVITALSHSTSELVRHSECIACLLTKDCTQQLGFHHKAQTQDSGLSRSKACKPPDLNLPGLEGQPDSHPLSITPCIKAAEISLLGFKLLTHPSADKVRSLLMEKLFIEAKWNDLCKAQGISVQDTEWVQAVGAFKTAHC